jgi:hypothetical protein
MPKGRSYTKRDRIVAVVAADMTSTEAAATAAGIPRSTLRYWMEDPELAVYRQNAREAISEEATVVARLAWQHLADAIRSGTMEPRDLILAAGMATDKMQLLSGQATARVETKELVNVLDDHERATLRDLIEGALAEPAPSPAGTDPVGTGAEVRQ